MLCPTLLESPSQFRSDEGGNYPLRCSRQGRIELLNTAEGFLNEITRPHGQDDMATMVLNSKVICSSEGCEGEFEILLRSIGAQPEHYRAISKKITTDIACKWF